MVGRVPRLCLLWKRDNALGLLRTLRDYIARWRVRQQKELYRKPLPPESSRRRAVTFEAAALRGRG
jgi:hypothetical protein